MEENRLQQCASLLSILYHAMNRLSSRANIDLTKPDKYVTIVIRRTAKTVGGSILSSRDGGEQYERFRCDLVITFDNKHS